MTLSLSSPVLSDRRQIPNHFSRVGGNVSPPVEWHGAPAGTRSYALIVEDPDAPGGIFRHWAVYDIPADAQGLAEGAGSAEQGAPLHTGVNDFGNSHYDGPQPPLGDGIHHYLFKLFALNTPHLDLPTDSPAAEILAAAQEHSLAEASLVGTFELLQPAPSEDNAGPDYRGVRRGVVDANEKAGTGTEPVRNTPPAGDWNDIA